MDINLIPISDEEFKSKVNIRFNNIMNGFNNFINFTLNPIDINKAEATLIKIIEDIFNRNDKEFYLDFYINKVSEEDKKKLLSLLTKEDRKILIQIIKQISNQGIYFKLTSADLIPFFTRLNTKEVFFVTFYFTNKPITIWGNYGMKFPCFFNTDDTRDYYLNLFKNNELI